MLARGTCLGPYEIGDLIGQGGMGEVYRARDTRLERSVAIKVLAAGEGRTGDGRARFAREARAIAALEHPHICTLYDVGEHNGIDYLVMPLLDGGSLAARLTRGRVPLDEALAIGAQILDALESAHRAGFVHRDLKPANIMLTTAASASGTPQVKLLDFGLTKLFVPTATLVGKAESTVTMGAPSVTLTGTMVGTPQYMAPEQIEGKPVDVRTDVFAFGAVLHELLTGQRAFSADSPAGVIAAILEREPPALLTLRPEAPPALDAIVRRCLAKSPDGRFQSAADLRFALELLSSTDASPAATVAARSVIASRDRWRATAAAAVGLAAIAVWWSLRTTVAPAPLDVPTLLNPQQVTNALGIEDYPAWSPDGRTLAYAANALGSADKGRWDIWVVQVGGTEPLNRTTDSTADDRFPSWSPNGQQLAFWSDRDGGGCYVMPALAGAARKVAAASRLDPNPPAWSSDGQQLACVILDETDVFAEIHDLGGRPPVRILLPGSRGRRLFLSWSPDQKAFAYIDTAAGLTADASQLWIVRLSDGKAFAVTDGRSRTWSPSWSPAGDAVYFVSNLGGAMDLWRQPLSSDSEPSGSPRRVTSGIGMRAARLSSDGLRLAYSQGRRLANVWRMPIREGRLGTWADARQITFDQAFVESLDVSSDGARLVVTSDRAGNPDIWTLRSDGGNLQQVVADPAPDFAPTWSPDGRAIAFTSYRSGNRDVWTTDAEGGPARQLTDDPATDNLPSWSPDGQSIVFLSNRAGLADLWIMPAAGGAPRRVAASGPRLEARWSPDGRRLLASSNVGELFLLSPDQHGQDVRLAQQARKGVWSRDGQRVYFSGSGLRSQEILTVGIDGTGERLLADLRGRRGKLGDISSDGQTLYFTWEEGLGDIWVMDVLPTPRR